MQFQVPQFIESEDKIIGPLSLKQFMYIAIPGFLMFLLFFILQTIVWVVITIIVMVVGVAFAFIKYNGQRLPAVIASVFKYIWQPKFFLWSPKAADASRKSIAPQKPTPEAFVTENTPAGTITDQTEALKVAEKNRVAFASGNAPLEKDEVGGDDRLKSLWLRLATTKGNADHEGEPSFNQPQKSKEIFELFQRITGEREVARRVDYR